MSVIGTIQSLSSFTFLSCFTIFFSSVFPEAPTVVHKDPREQRKSPLEFTIFKQHSHSHTHTIIIIDTSRHTNTPVVALKLSLTHACSSKYTRLAVITYVVCDVCVCVRVCVCVVGVGVAQWLSSFGSQSDSCAQRLRFGGCEFRDEEKRGEHTHTHTHTYAWGCLPHSYFSFSSEKMGCIWCTGSIAWQLGALLQAASLQSSY